MSAKSTQNGTIQNHQSVQNNNTNATKDAIFKESVDLQSEVKQQDQQVNLLPPSSQLNNNMDISSSLMMGDKSNNSDSVDDEEKIIIEVIFSGQIQDLKHFGLKNRSLNYVRYFEQASHIDKKVSPLIVAVYCGNIDHVKELFNSKADIDVNYVSKKQGISPLMVACMRGQFEILQYLIQKGADVSQISADGLTSLYYCFYRLEEDQNYFENKNLCMKMACYLLEKGANINQVVNQENKHTLLMQFCNIQEDLDLREKDINMSMIEFLIVNGADIFLKNREGQDCYDLIEKHPYRDEVIEIFEQYEHSYESNLKSTADNSNVHSAYFTNTPPTSRNNILKSKKKSQVVLSSQSQNSSQNIQGQNQQQQQNAVYQQQIKLQQQSAKLQQKYSQNIEIEGQEKKKSICCSFMFF